MFCAFLFVLRISGFFPVSRISPSGWFLFYLVSRFGGPPFTLLNPLTGDLLLLPPHTTAHLSPNHNLPPHNSTLLPFTQDLTGEERTHALGRHGGGERDHTCPCQWGGGETSGVHIFEVCWLSSLSESFAQQPNRWVGTKEFENLTLAPLIWGGYD